MKVVRCKDCILDGRAECPLAYIEKQTLCFVEHSPMFFCAKGRTSEDFKQTRGDEVRNMTDKQLAVLFNDTEQSVANHFISGGSMQFGTKQIDFYTKWFSTVPEEEWY